MKKISTLLELIENGGNLQIDTLNAEIADLNHLISSDNNTLLNLQSELNIGILNDYVVDNDSDDDTYCDLEDVFPNDPVSYTHLTLPTNSLV